MDTKILGVKNNKAKSRRQTKNKAKYAAQFLKTEANRKRKQLKHLKKVQKKHPR